MVSKLAFALFFLTSLVGEAREIVWLDLTPQLTYRDLSTNCKTDGYFHHYFGAELDGRDVKAAVLKAGGLEVYHRGIAFEKSELASIKLEKDALDRTWLTGLHLNERVLRWVLQNSGSALDGCTPSQPLTSVTPEPFTFSFEIESLGAGPMMPTSNFGKFGGTRKDGRAYQAGLYFVQKQM